MSHHDHKHDNKSGGCCGGVDETVAHKLERLVGGLLAVDPCGEGVAELHFERLDYRRVHNEGSVAPRLGCFRVTKVLAHKVDRVYRRADSLGGLGRAHGVAEGLLQPLEGRGGDGVSGEVAWHLL